MAGLSWKQSSSRFFVCKCGEQFDHYGIALVNHVKAHSPDGTVLVCDPQEDDSETPSP